MAWGAKSKVDPLVLLRELVQVLDEKICFGGPADPDPLKRHPWIPGVEFADGKILSTLDRARDRLLEE